VSQRECQRRTGAPFGVGAYCSKNNVKISGEGKLYTREATSGHPFHQHFCPACGTTLYRYSAYKPDMIGIAVGGFADPQFLAPLRSVWEQTRHEWVKLPNAIQHFQQGRTGVQPLRWWLGMSSVTSPAIWRLYT
jgi:hypothetical protein